MSIISDAVFNICSNISSINGAAGSKCSPLNLNLLAISASYLLAISCSVKSLFFGLLKTDWIFSSAYSWASSKWGWSSFNT